MIVYHYESRKDVMICTPLRCGTGFTHTISKIEKSFNKIDLNEYKQEDFILHITGLKIIEKWENTKFFFVYRNPLSRYISGLSRLSFFQENNIPIYEPNLLKTEDYKKVVFELSSAYKSEELYDFTHRDDHLTPVITLVCLLYSHSNDNVVLLNIKDMNNLIKTVFEYDDIKIKRIMNMVRARPDSNTTVRHFEHLFKYVENEVTHYNKNTRPWNFFEWIETESNLYDFLTNSPCLDKKMLITALSKEFSNPKSLLLLKSLSNIIPLSTIYEFSNLEIKNALSIAEEKLSILMKDIRESERNP